MLSVVVDRTKWGRGTGVGKLLDAQTGLMCCLGFACLAAGIEKEDISGRRMPNELYDLLPSTLEALTVSVGRHPFGGANNSGVANELALANDDEDIGAGEREVTIIEQGKTAGILFSFIGPQDHDPEP